MPRLLENLRFGLNSLRETLFRGLFRARFKYDVFISYSHSEKPYAVNLKKQLSNLDFSCFIDEEEAPPGSALDPTLTKALKKSAVLVLLATERALTRPYIISEFEKFAATERTIVPINIRGALSKNDEAALSRSPWNVIPDRKIVWIDESDEAFTKHNPSPAIADGIDKLFKYTRRNVRVRAEIIGTAVLVLIASLGAGFVIKAKTEEVTLQTDRADKAKQKADDQEKIAIDAGIEAEKQLANAARAKADANKQQTIADERKKEAEHQQELARRASAEAEKQQKLAKDAKAEADRQLTIGQARQLANQSELDRGTNTDDLLRSTSLAIRSLQLHPTLEGDSAMRKSLNLIPSLIKETPYQRKVDAAALSPNATAIGLLTTKSEVEIQREGKEVVRKSRPAAHSRIALSNDGTYFATAGPRSVLIQETDTEKCWPIEMDDDASIQKIALSSGGKYLAVIDSGDESFRVVVFERESMKPIATKQGSFEFEEFKSVAFSSRKEELLAVGAFEQRRGSMNGSLSTWLIRPQTLRGNECVREDCKEEKTYTFVTQSALRQPISLGMVAIGSDENHVITANENMALVWRRTRLDSYEQIARVPLENPLAIAFDRHAQHIYVVSQPTESSKSAGETTATLKIWQPSGRGESPEEDPISIVEFEGFGISDSSGDRKHFAVADEQGKVRVRDLTQKVPSDIFVNRSRLRSLESIELSWNGQFMALAGTASNNEPQVLVYQKRNGSYEETPINFKIPLGTNLKTLALSRDGLLLATTTSQNQQINLWNIQLGRAARTKPIPTGSEVLAILFSLDGERLAALCKTGEIRIWKVPTGEAVATLAGSSVTGASDRERNVAFSHDGRYIAVGNVDRTASVFVTSTGEELIRLPHEDPITSISFSWDGKYLVTETEATSLDTSGGNANAFWRWLLEPQDLIAETCRRSPRACESNRR